MTHHGMRGLIIASLLVLAIADHTVVLPSPAQLRYQDTDFIALIHFNMGTFAHNGDPCCDAGNWNVKAPYATGKTSDPATFNPVKLNTTQWMESITALGANIAILTAKHGCGFCLWPTSAKLPSGIPYGYNVGAKGAAVERDVLREFVDSANAAGVGYGFYYSIMKSFYLCHSFSGTNSCLESILPGQHNFSAEQYKAIVTEQVTELWTQYGNLTEIWVDSGSDGLGDLMAKLQPQAVGTPRNPTGWCGTESGHPTKDVGGGPVWSVGGGYHGDPNSSFWEPKFCDPQLFQEHVWFWEENLTVRTLEMMIPIYHDIVGRGMVMELAFSIDREGLVQDTHALVYKQLGDWVKECYGTPLASTSPGMGKGPFLLHVQPHGTNATIDRAQLQEDVVMGQRIRRYTLEQLVVGQTWMVVAKGQAIGTKRILLFDQPLPIPPSGLSLRLNVEQAVATPVLKQFAVFAPCRTS